MQFDIEEIKQLFFQDAQDHLEAMEKALSSLESDTSDHEAIDALFRSVHSLKGDSGCAGLESIGEALHSFETELDKLRTRQRGFGDDDLRVVREVVDQIAPLIEAIKSDRGVPQKFAEAVAQLVDELGPSIDQGAREPAQSDLVVDLNDDDAFNDPPSYPPFFGGFLIERNLLTIDQVLAVLAEQRQHQTPLGEILIQSGKLTVKQLM